MPEPTIRSIVFVALKDSVHWRSMKNMSVESCSYQIVERAHVARKSGEIIRVGLLMY